MERMSVNTGIRLTPTHVKKLDRLATDMRTTRNRLLGMLIDSAEVESKPVLSVGEKNNRCDAQELSHQSIATVGA
jgi:hypothetical protein